MSEVHLKRRKPNASVYVSEDDIDALETAGEALIRSDHTQTAIRLFALALRLRSETGLHPQRRATDACPHN